MFFIILILIMVPVVICTQCLVKLLFPDCYRRTVTRGIALLNFALLAGMGIGFGIDAGEGYGSSLTGATLQLASIIFLLEIFTDFLLAILVLARRCYWSILSVPVDSRRRQLVKGAFALPAIALGVNLYGSFAERKQTVINNIHVSIDGLIGPLKGFRIAQLSDVHLGPFYSLDDLRKLMEQSKGTGADVLVLTGDVFDYPRNTMQAAKIINEYVHDFPYGIYYCRGNHEHFRGLPLVEMALSQTEIKELLNDNVCLVKGEGGSRPLYLCGVDYPMPRSNFDSLQRVYTKNAFANIPDNAVTVLLAHHPDFIETAADYNCTLVLSGHTHGGQLGIMGIPVVPPVFKYMRGIYHKANTMLYVHSGNGSWFPIRIGCPPEIAVFTLDEKN